MTAQDRQVGGSHYKDMPDGYRPREIIQALGLSWDEGNALKYLLRHRTKNGRQDLEKAIHYIELLLEQEYPYSKKGVPQELGTKPEWPKAETHNDVPVWAHPETEGVPRCGGCVFDIGDCAHTLCRFEEREDHTTVYFTERTGTK